MSVSMKQARSGRMVRPTARRAFTLLEIIVVVTIIAMLAALVGPRVLKHIANTNVKVAKTEAVKLAETVQLWCTDQGLSRPPEDFDLATLVEGDDPYLNKAEDIIDPWGRPYMIRVPGEVNPDFDVYTFGADGQQGGEGENADITN